MSLVKYCALITLKVCLLTAKADFPAEVPQQPVKSGQCSDDSLIKEAALNVIAAQVAPVLNKRYGPPCGCKGGFDKVWNKFFDLNDTIKWNNCTFDSGIPCKYLTTVPVAHSNGLCGKIIANRSKSRRNGDTFAFENYIINGKNNLNGSYVDGVSIVRNTADRRGIAHVWTFAAPQGNVSAAPYKNCACSSPKWPYQTPPFVEGHYFCDFNQDGALWSGEKCESGNKCCLTPHPPPWFCLESIGTTSFMDPLTIRLFGDAMEIEDIELYDVAA